MKPLVNSVSIAALEALFNGKPHAVMLTGKAGIGLLTIAQYYAKQTSAVVFTVLPEKDEKIDVEKGTITVQSIRRLYDTTRTIQPSGRVIIIDYAERMGTPAQNAFLKLLEEPTEGTQFILLSHKPEVLLPTIRSRSQQVEVRPVSLKQSEAFLDELKVKDATKRAQLLFIAAGLPAELTRLVQDDAYFASRAGLVKDAREYVTGSAYAKLLIAKKYKDSRPQALQLLEDAMKQLEQSMAKGGDESNIKVLTRLTVLHKRLSEQGNVRLQLSSAVMV